MNQNIASQVFQVRGMSCSSCELKLENVLRKMDGVKEVNASFAKSTVEVKFDAAIVTADIFEAKLTELGYEVDHPTKDSKKGSMNQLIGIGIIVFALYVLIKSTVGFSFIPQVDKSVGYGMLFIVGLLTSLHCIAMCGGINLAQSVRYQPVGNETQFSKLKPSLLYNSGRVISYTVTGGIVGAFGSAISFSGTAKGIVAIAGGIFMVVIGINMLNIFPWLRRFKISIPKFLGNKIYHHSSKRGPFYIGLLNGLMPCGPLQTMQLYALGTGSFFTGATSMFLFGLGTVPFMFGFGAVSSWLSSQFTQRMLKVCAVFVIVLGLTMVNRGLSLSGVTIAAGNPIATGASGGNVAQIQGGVQVVTTTIDSGRYQPFVVQKGIPVRWIMKAKAEDLNGCNNPVTIPQYKIQKRLVPGDNVIEFTPDQAGTITYTCWMGMIRSYIKVVPKLSSVTKEDIDQVNRDQKNPSGGNVGGSCCAGANSQVP